MTPDWLDTQRPRLVRLCASIAGDADAGEDLAQETLLEAWRHRHKLRDPAGAEQWLNAIARNVCLRHGRRRGREAGLFATMDAQTADELRAELGRGDLEELLDGALAELPPDTRDVLVHHYIDGWAHAEIAGREGVTEAAVSMRISRGRRALRHLLESELGVPVETWADTRVRCSACGTARLQMLREADRVVFRCRECGPRPSSAYDLSNPSFRALVGQLVRPTAILARAAAWASAYFGGGTGDARCTRCRASIRLRPDTRKQLGLFGGCAACGEEVWSSLAGVAQARPEARAFSAQHGRIRTLPEEDIGYRGADATLVRLEATRGSPSLDVVFDRTTLRVLATH